MCLDKRYLFGQEIDCKYRKKIGNLIYIWIKTQGILPSGFSFCKLLVVIPSLRIRKRLTFIIPLDISCGHLTN